MTAPMDCQVVGRWRVVEADLWDRAYLDLVEPAYVDFGEDGHGAIAFGAVTGGMDLEYAHGAIFFTGEGFDEMDEVSGSGAAELQDDGTLEIDFAFHHGDEALLKAQRQTSAAAC